MSTQVLRAQRQRANGQGFTLIEVMIVTALIAIVTTVSVVSYRQYVLRANRTDASALLLRIAAAQERFYLENNAYTNALDATGLNTGTLSERGFYEASIELDANPALGYTATVEPVAGESQDRDQDCREMTIDESGQRGSTPEPIEICWR